jgi:hypothetical protein
LTGHWFGKETPLYTPLHNSHQEKHFAFDIVHIMSVYADTFIVECLYPVTAIERDDIKRASDIKTDIDTISKAFTKMIVFCDVFKSYKSAVNDGSATLDENKMMQYQDYAIKATAKFEALMAFCSYRIARNDFFAAALLAGKTDAEIYKMLSSATNETPSIGKEMFKGLVNLLGGIITDLSEFEKN